MTDLGSFDEVFTGGRGVDTNSRRCRSGHHTGDGVKTEFWGTVS